MCRDAGGTLTRQDPMEKLRLELDALKVESFDAGADATGRGTAHGYQDTTCSKQPTCGIASRGQEGYEAYPRTLYACCI
jgi:hypothetical protein